MDCWLENWPKTSLQASLQGHLARLWRHSNSGLVKKEVILEYNKNNVTLALNCMLNNLEGMISVLGIYIKDRKNI